MGDDLNDLMSSDLASRIGPVPLVYSGARAPTDGVLCEAPTGTPRRLRTAIPASPPVRRTRAERPTPIASSEILDA